MFFSRLQDVHRILFLVKLKRWFSRFAEAWERFTLRFHAYISITNN